MSRPRRRESAASVIWRLAITIILSTVATTAAADRVVLKDGMVFTGELDLKDERIEVAERQRITTISRTLLLHPEAAVDEQPPISFKLSQPVPPKAPRPVAPLAGFARVEPFDEFGRRGVAVVSETGRIANHVQAIHALFPTHVETDVVEGSFRSTASLAVIPGPTLRKILRRCIDPTKEQERIRLVEFLLQADRIEEARQEIAEFKRDGFGAENLTTLTNRLSRRVTDLLLMRLERAAAVDDLVRCREIAREAGKFANAEQRARLEGVVQRFEKAAADVANAKRVVANAAMAMAAHPRAEELTAAAKAIDGNLAPGLLDRLKPTLFLAERGDAKPDDLLAVAISGWCAGPELAQPDLERAADLWRARTYLTAAVEGDEIVFQDRLRRLASPPAEGRARVGTEVLATMIGLLPAKPSDRSCDFVSQVKREGSHGSTVEYLVYLPPSYTSARRWPAVVALHDQNADPQKEMGAWRGSALDFGVVICCPIWRKDDKTNWGFGVEDHVRLEQVVVDLRRRFAIDPDRVVLAGRGAGGDVAWDFATGHADEFAGLISLGGLPLKYAERCTGNFGTLPIFSIHGGLNMQRASLMSNEVVKLCAKKCDAIHIVYPARGGESFASDMPMLFDWMSRRRRTPFPKRLAALAARETDRRFYWLEVNEFKEGALVPPDLLAKSRFGPASLTASATDAGTLLVRTNNVAALDVLLSPKLVAVDAPGFAVKVNNKVVAKGPIEPDLETMLRHLRSTGDASRLVVKVVSVRRP